MSDIRKVLVHEDEHGRKVTAHVAWDNESDIIYTGHAFVPVAAVRQVIPFSFVLHASDIGDAYKQFDDVFKVAQVKAMESIMSQIQEQSTGIVAPGQAAQMKPITTPTIDLGVPKK